MKRFGQDGVGRAGSRDPRCGEALGVDAAEHELREFMDFVSGARDSEWLVGASDFRERLRKRLWKTYVQTQAHRQTPDRLQPLLARSPRPPRH